MTPDSHQFETLAVIRLIGQTADFHAIPADVLIRSLAGIQRLVYIMASDNENKTYAQRFRVSESIEQHYKLVCKVPAAGSYAMPLTLEARDIQLSILPKEYVNIFDKVQSFLEAVGGSQLAEINRVFSDRTLTKRALVEVRKFLPNADDSWRFGFTSACSNKTEVLLGKESVKHIDDWLSRQVPSESVITVTGELIKIDFDERKLYLRYPPTRQVIECIYSDELEESMIENLREYIQVTGEFTVDANLEVDPGFRAAS